MTPKLEIRWWYSIPTNDIGSAVHDEYDIVSNWYEYNLRWNSLTIHSYTQAYLYLAKSWLSPRRHGVDKFFITLPVLRGNNVTKVDTQAGDG